MPSLRTLGASGDSGGPGNRSASADGEDRYYALGVAGSESPLGPVLKTRVVTAIVLLAGFAVLVTVTDAREFSYVLALVTAIAAWEWGRLSLQSHRLAGAFYALLVLSVCLAGLYPGHRSDAAMVLAWSGALAWCLVPLVLRFRYRPGRVPASFPWLGALLLVSACLAMAGLRQVSVGGVDGYLLWVMLVIVWVADSGAYFVGRAAGRHKLAPRISPGKTWEGFFGGVGAASAVGMLLLGRIDGVPLAWALAIAAITAVFSVLGDLLESLLKRLAGAKDSGTILPGHGGVLDRVDGILAAAPVFLVLVSVAGVAA